VAQDALLDLPQLGGRVQPEFGLQERPRPMVGSERVGLAAAAVKGDHQLPM